MTSLFESDRTLVMGVLNVTPDSFSDGGRFYSRDAALDQALEMLDEGADMIDIGGESSRPGSDVTPEEEELSRVLPIVEKLSARTDVPISIDSYKTGVARRCVEAGARIINDIRGLRDPAMVEVAVETRAAVILMHMRGEPKTMQRDTVYDDVVVEVRDFLVRQADAARKAGVNELAIDPGIGFGKSAEQNFELLARLGELTTTGYPLLVGPSRKSFLGALASKLPVDERLEGTLAAVTAAVLEGAKIVRVHDVMASRRAVEVADAIRGAVHGG